MTGGHRSERAPERKTGRGTSGFGRKPTRRHCSRGVGPNRKAKHSTRKENSFRRYRLNQWTEQDIRWIKMETWDACVGSVNAAELQGEECYAGLDLAVSQDLNALVLAFPLEGEGYKLLPYFWAPRESAKERQRRDRVPYLTWARGGLIELTDGDVADYQVIRKRINEIADTYGI